MPYRARWLAWGGAFFHFECLNAGVTGRSSDWAISRGGHPIGTMNWRRYETMRQFEARAGRRLAELLQVPLEEAKG
jgi:hypothetical protein